ncbi:helix-turn-helix domain-containing protein [Xanthocytophaga agilis]|uniref:Helix-turn-helix domain-containing protein n=1 Tax=Xanthocytophaga agilis TaxID=3048010 RepID=A0AAE3RA15_9BACT|nr:helix-turn-helix domain-containing protein [Xanthocytophaga agilis]MDJ1503527.1 helix-turn-helix domain-containing protein [Xanthocytophaga agilis]
MFNPFEDIQLRLVRLEALLLELQSITINPSPISDKQLGGIDLAVQITGLAKSTVYNLVSEGRLPHMKRGKKLYFSRTELENWIADGKQKTLQELEAEVEQHLTKQGKRR